MKLLKAFFSVFCGIFLGRTFNFLSSVLIARMAGAESIGDYTLFMTIFVICSESTGAIDTSLIKFCSNKGYSKKETVKCAFIMKFSYSIILVTILFGSKFIFSTKIAEYWNVIMGAGISGCLFSIFMIEIAWKQYNLNYTKVSIMKFLFQFFSFLFIIYGLFFGFHATEYLISIYVGIGFVFSIITIRMHMDAIKSKLHNTTFKHFLTTSLVLLLAALINQISSRLDVFFITGFLNKVDIGYYGAALRVASIMTLFTAVTSVILTPKAPEAVSNLGKRKKYLKKVFVILLLQIFLLIVVIAFSPLLVSILFGPDYAASIIPLRILIFQVILGSAIVPFQALVQVGPRPREIFKINIKKLCIGLLCSFLLVPLFGLVGAAIVGIITNIFLLYSFISVQNKIDLEIAKAV